jgi:hypothetical protein
MAFSQVRSFVPQSIAVILESRVGESEIAHEAEKVAAILEGTGSFQAGRFEQMALPA